MATSLDPEPEQLWLKFEPYPELAARAAQTALDAKRKAMGLAIDNELRPLRLIIGGKKAKK